MRTHTSFVRPAMLLAALASLAPCVHAADINPSNLGGSQSNFRLLSEDLGAVVAFKPMIPAESMGITGFDIGVAVSGTKLVNHAVWETAAGGSSIPSTLPIPMLRIHKGLPFDIDIGASFTKVPSTNIQIAGGELRWAFMPGSTVLPAVAVRGSYSALTGVDKLKLSTAGVDLSISKGFLFLTPYAGVGTVSVKSTPDVAGLSAVSLTQSKVFAGLNMNLGLTNILLETDKTGKATSYGVKLGLRF